MRALIFHGPGDLRLEDVPRPESSTDGDVLVQVEVALTDGTDLKAFRRGHPVLLGPPPSPFGHEFCGVDVATGRRVVAANSAPCGSCARLQPRAGDALRSTSSPSSTAPTPSSSSCPSGSRRKNLLAVPAGMPPELAAMVEPLACCLHGVDAAGVAPGDTVAVIGLGPIGLMLCACVADAGGRPVGVGSRAERRALAPLVRRRDSAPAQGADVVIEAAGTTEAWQLALELVRPGGTVLAFGGLPREAHVARRPVPDPLRGGDAEGRVPPHPAPRAGGARRSSAAAPIRSSG